MKTILVVDDEDAIAKTLADILSDEGYHVETAINGAAGLAQLSELAPDLIVCDVMMPIMGGHEMLEEVRANPCYARTPVILMSAVSRHLKGVPCRAVVALTRCLSKPFELQVFLDSVHALIGRPSDGAGLRSGAGS